MNETNPEAPLCEAELNDLARGIFYLWQGSTRDFGGSPVMKGLKVPQYIVMRALHRGPMRMTELAELTATSSANVTGMVDRLVERKLATRDHHPDDRRVVMVTLTPFGTEMLLEQAARFRDRLAELLAPLDAQECSEFVRLLSKIRGAEDAAQQD